MNQAVLNRLSAIFSAVLDEDIQLEPSFTARDVDGWDSLSNIRLILEIEKVFNINVSSVEIGKFKNVGDLVEVIESRMR